MQGGTREQVTYLPLELTLEPSEEFTDLLTNGQYLMNKSLLTNQILLVYRWKFQGGQKACYLEDHCPITKGGQTEEGVKSSSVGFLACFFLAVKEELSKKMTPEVRLYSSLWGFQ